jgi:hypothetical protein
VPESGNDATAVPISSVSAVELFIGMSPPISRPDRQSSSLPGSGGACQVASRAIRIVSELVKESDRRFQIADCEFINVFEMRLYLHSQFAMRHPESISSHPLGSIVPYQGTDRRKPGTRVE